MQNKKFRSIRTKLVLLFSISAALAIVLSSVSIFSYTLFVTKDAGVKSLSQLTTVIGQNLVAPLEFDDIDAAQLMLSSLMVNENIKAGYIFKNFEVFTTYVKKGQNKNEISETILYVYEKNDKKKLIEYLDFNDIVISYPIFSSGEFIGTFCMVSDTSDIVDAIRGQAIMQLIVSFVVLVLIILLSLRVQKIFTDPILELKNAMDEVSLKNNYDTEVHAANRNDEFASLFFGFNSMLDTIKIQTKELEDINKKAEESMEYASLIQGSIIPDNKDFKKYFHDYFVIWQPKEIVGGDIYLFEKLRNDDECIVMIMDCSGHGVHGAFVTILVKAIERSIIAKINNSDEDVSPANLLGVFNRSMKHILKQEDADSISNAGFDGGILYYNKKKKIIRYAGANIPLLCVDERGTFEILEADKHSIGYKKSVSDYIFNEHEFEAKEGMEMYLCSDGYYEQSGGVKKLPLGKTKFIDTIKKARGETCADQQEIFLDTLGEHQGENQRTDDVTLIGLKL